MDSKRWEVLQYRNIARHASAKQIKKFVKALDVRLLRQIIELYADSIVTQLPKQYESLSASKTLTHWKESKQNDDEFKLSADDVTILKLLKKHCGNKRASMYQNQSKLLLSVPMEIMSYSFSFLSFSELSIIQRVCSYFMNASNKYSNLSHHHLNIGSRFVRNAISNQLNLNSLTHFKSICITYQSAHIRLFTYVIQKIITQSQTSLQSLTIDFSVSYSYRPDGMIGDVMLYLILNTVPLFPALHTIHWRRGDRDSCGRSGRGYSSWRFRVHRFEYNALVKVMRQRIPRLLHLEIKTKSYDMEGTIKSIVDCATLNSLRLTNHSLLSTDVIPHILFKLKHVNTLCINAGAVTLHHEIAKKCIKNDVLDGNAKLILSKHKISVINHSIRILNLKFTYNSRSSAPAPSTTFISNILIYFFVHCVNITDLTLDFGSLQSPVFQNVKWDLLFDLLMEQKARYGAHDAESLSKLTIVGTQNECLSIIKGLHDAIPVHSKLKKLEQIHVTNHVKRVNRKLSLKLNECMRTTIDTVSVFESLKAFAIEIPSMSKEFSVNWNCNAPKPTSHVDLFRGLTKLDLDQVDLFECDAVPTIFKHIPTLSYLSISTNIPEETILFSTAFIKQRICILNEHQDSFHHPTLRTLKLSLAFETRRWWVKYRRVEDYIMEEVNDNVRYILSYFYLVCPHITELCMDWQMELRDQDKINVSWPVLFDLLNTNKIKCSAKPLSKLSIKGEQYLLINTMNGITLSSNRSHHYIKYLTHMELKQSYHYGTARTTKVHINETLMEFMKVFKEKDCELESIRFSINHDTLEKYCEYILIVLQNVPKSLQHLYLRCRGSMLIGNPTRPRKNRYDDTSWDIVKCLVNMNANNDLNIKDIELDGLSMHSKAIQYVKFFFGFENKLVCHDAQYRHKSLTITFKS
eukprot:192081_1